MKIVLLGYMASGKSAVGKKLAEQLNLLFIDLDNYIEECEKMSISNIFEQKGEIYFRKMESIYLKQLFELKKDCIISLGGGTPCYSNNMDVITENSDSFYLKATINTIFTRLKNKTSQRPLVSTIGIDNLKEFIAKHLFERNVYYEKASETIIVDEKSIESIVLAIQANLT